MDEIRFRTELEKLDCQGILHYSNPILSIGSCFATEIGQQLEKDLFDIIINPFGPLYNPVSISKGLRTIAQNRIYTKNDLRKDKNGLWHSFEHHSLFSSLDPENCLSKINKSMELANKYLYEPNLILMITLGSARGFRHIENRNIVANCHKFPSSEFEVVDFNVDELIDELTETLNLIRQINKTVKVIFTVSPVRHISYGLHNDKISKATLLLVIDKLQHKFSFVDYFPSYEIMMDDLRDYRFYEADMVHPSETAVQYIYKRFLDTYFDKDEEPLMKKCRDYIKRRCHRLQNPQSKEGQEFIKRNLTIKNELCGLSPHIKAAIERMQDERQEIYN